MARSCPPRNCPRRCCTMPSAPSSTGMPPCCPVRCASRPPCLSRPWPTTWTMAAPAWRWAAPPPPARPRSSTAPPPTPLSLTTFTAKPFTTRVRPPLPPPGPWPRRPMPRAWTCCARWWRATKFPPALVPPWAAPTTNIGTTPAPWAALARPLRPPPCTDCRPAPMPMQWPQWALLLPACNKPFAWTRCPSPCTQAAPPRPVCWPRKLRALV